LGPDLLTTNTVTVDGFTIPYDERPGNGEIILLVHGITTWRFVWHPVMESFSAGPRLIALDLLGCGDADKPLDVSYSLQAHAERLEKFRRALGIDTFHLVGHDLGGGIAQIYAVQHGNRLETLTLMNTVGYDYWPVQPITTMRTPIIRQLAMATLDLGMFRVLIRRGLYHKDLLTDALMEKYLRPIRSAEGRKAFLHFARCLDAQDLLAIEQDLQAIPVSTLILRGAADAYLSFRISNRLKEDIPGSRLRILEDAGHYIQIDRPDLVAELLTAHLDTG